MCVKSAVFGPSQNTHDKAFRSEVDEYFGDGQTKNEIALFQYPDGERGELKDLYSIANTYSDWEQHPNFNVYLNSKLAITPGLTHFPFFTYT